MSHNLLYRLANDVEINPMPFCCLITKVITYELLTKREVKMAGYPAILTEQAWSIKDLLYDFFRALKRKPVACTINGAR